MCSVNGLHRPHATPKEPEAISLYPGRRDPNPSVRVRVTEEPSPRSGRLKVAHGASRGNAAPPYQGAPAGARENGSGPPCSVRPRFNHGRSGTHRVMRITGPPGLSETSRFSFSSSRQAATGKRLKRPCRGWKSFGHTYPRLAPWATFKRPLRGLGSSVGDKLTDGLGSGQALSARRRFPPCCCAGHQRTRASPAFCRW